MLLIIKLPMLVFSSLLFYTLWTCIEDINTALLSYYGLQVKFGVLFNDDRCANIFEALVGTLRAAKKRKILTYDGELLLQGVHDNVEITLLPPPAVAAAWGTQIQQSPILYCWYASTLLCLCISWTIWYSQKTAVGWCTKLWCLKNWLVCIWLCCNILDDFVPLQKLKFSF